MRSKVLKSNWFIHIFITFRSKIVLNNITYLALLIFDYFNLNIKKYIIIIKINKKNFNKMSFNYQKKINKNNIVK